MILLERIEHLGHVKNIYAFYLSFGVSIFICVYDGIILECICSCTPNVVWQFYWNTYSCDRYWWWLRAIAHPGFRSDIAVGVPMARPNRRRHGWPYDPYWDQGSPHGDLSSQCQKIHYFDSFFLNFLDFENHLGGPISGRGHD